MSAYGVGGANWGSERLDKANAKLRAMQAAEVAERRKQVAFLWANGQSTNRIAQTLGLDRHTVGKDIRAYQQELAAGEFLSLEAHRQESITVRLEARAHLMAIMNDPKLPTNSQNHVNAPLAINQIQNDIDRLRGVSAPEAMNIAAVAETANALLETFREQVARLGIDPDEAQAELARNLQARIGGTSMGVMLGAPDEPLELPEDAEDGEEGAAEEDEPEDTEDDDSADEAGEEE